MNEKEHTNDPRITIRTTGSFTRRQFLQTSGVSAVATFASRPTLGKVDRKTRIVTARGGVNHEVRQTTKVPKIWRSHELEMRNITKSLAELYLDNKFVISVGRVASDTQIGGFTATQPEITVANSTTQSETDTIPESLSDIGIDSQNTLVDQIKIRTDSGDGSPVCEGFTTVDPYPGGIAIYSDGDEWGGGTSGYRMYDDYDTYILTANHVLTSDCDLSTNYAEAYDGSIIGPVVDGHKYHDWALVRADSIDISSIAGYIWYDGGNRAWIDGYKTQSGLETLVGESSAVRKQGKTTGYQYGTVVGMNNWYTADCFSMDGDGVGVEVDTAKGDSGGPIWEYDSANDVAYVITQASYGVNKSGTVSCHSTHDLYKKCHGYAAYKIVNSNPYYIG